MLYVRQIGREVIRAFERETRDEDVLDFVKSYAFRVPKEIIARSADVEFDDVPLHTFVQWTIKGLAEGAEQTVLWALDQIPEQERDANKDEVKRAIRAVRTIQEISLLLVDSEVAKAA
jgi:hypothetical protein